MICPKDSEREVLTHQGGILEAFLVCEDEHFHFCNYQKEETGNARICGKSCVKILDMEFLNALKPKGKRGELKYLSRKKPYQIRIEFRHPVDKKSSM